MKKLLLLVLLFSSFNLYAEVINVETKGNLQPENPLTCIDVATKDISKHTPADILIGSKKCIDKKDYLNASRLYQSALLYGLFDMARVKDKTAHQGIKLYERACSLNFSEACSFLTRVYKSGCDDGSKKACDNLKELEVKQSVSKRITTGKRKITKSKGFGKEDIDEACLNQNKPSKDGMQFDGKKADAKIMQLKAGKYKYNGGHLLLFRNNHFILQLPKDRDGVNGTDGPDLLASGIVGGCAKEQLSEAIQNNNLKGHTFKLIKRSMK